jgi:hypothetical protein
MRAHFWNRIKRQAERAGAWTLLPAAAEASAAPLAGEEIEVATSSSTGFGTLDNTPRPWGGAGSARGATQLLSRTAVATWP